MKSKLSIVDNKYIEQSRELSRIIKVDFIMCKSSYEIKPKQETNNIIIIDYMNFIN